MVNGKSQEKQSSQDLGFIRPEFRPVVGIGDPFRAGEDISKRLAPTPQRPRFVPAPGAPATTKTFRRELKAAIAGAERVEALRSQEMERAITRGTFGEGTITPELAGAITAERERRVTEEVGRGARQIEAGVRAGFEQARETGIFARTDPKLVELTEEFAVGAATVIPGTPETVFSLVSRPVESAQSIFTEATTRPAPFLARFAGGAVVTGGIGRLVTGARAPTITRSVGFGEEFTSGLTRTGFVSRAGAREFLTGVVQKEIVPQRGPRAGVGAVITETVEVGSKQTGLRSFGLVETGVRQLFDDRFFGVGRARTIAEVGRRARLRRIDQGAAFVGRRIDDITFTTGLSKTTANIRNIFTEAVRRRRGVPERIDVGPVRAEAVVRPVPPATLAVIEKQIKSITRPSRVPEIGVVAVAPLTPRRLEAEIVEEQVSIVRPSDVGVLDITQRQIRGPVSIIDFKPAAAQAQRLRTAQIIDVRPITTTALDVGLASITARRIAQTTRQQTALRRSITTRTRFGALPVVTQIPTLGVPLLALPIRTRRFREFDDRRLQVRFGLRQFRFPKAAEVFRL